MFIKKKKIFANSNRYESEKIFFYALQLNVVSLCQLGAVDSKYILPNTRPTDLSGTLLYASISVGTFIFYPYQLPPTPYLRQSKLTGYEVELY